MTDAMLKTSRDGQPAEETAYSDTSGEKANSVVATDPRPVRAINARRLDVDKVLERSLPPVEDRSRKLSRG